jgi:hypothetical protein
MATPIDRQPEGMCSTGEPLGIRLAVHDLL